MRQWERRLLVQRDRVVDHRLDAVLLKKYPELVAAGMSNYEQVVRVDKVVGHLSWDEDVSRKVLSVPLRSLPPPLEIVF
jgi:hypothetical protein